ncbi:sigma-54-dependent Fis family transcriptional regulator [Undibacterium fentianense]|uniref:Sigma-54-dependent Fis family transcriptional regulator n=1 Tax=Undibacterium fentianense TaxID=2828728 RepID=A0A941E4X9_9BURK|nr:sigma-54-dependent Fis family transcriptional regulator [Undibacterium fentianense]MBR7799813.1 sigma-54-dependent Fis family transcriptional regulator [Undibacterium fentianense]
MRQHAILPAPHLKQARLQLLEQGICPQADIDLRVAQSWQRSYSAGLSPLGVNPCDDNLNAAHLRQARELNHDLISHSEPVIEYLFEQVKHSHSMVILADAQGVLMHTLGDLDFLSKADRVALKCGASWAEHHRGTNAIGTALAASSEIEINGAEHYLEPNEFLTCAASPILSAQGQLMGILDISGDHRSRHPHTLGLVSTAAQMIENSMVMSACRQHVLVQIHPRAEGIGSVAQGLLAFSEEGCLVGANRKALLLLNLQYGDLGVCSWSHIFEQHWQKLLSNQRGVKLQADRVYTRSGAALFAMIHPQSRQVRQMIYSGVPNSAAHYSPPPVVEEGSQTPADQMWQGMAEKARKVIDKQIPLLITGESGVGKEVFAQTIHRRSARKAAAFVAVNCAAIPEHLIEAELFGYVAGAFTGASKNGAMGKLREAHGGTLFLDEIGDMPLPLQTRLLRVLQERQVTPLGSSQSLTVDFNLVCATHQHLKSRVAQGLFREDLFYRINGLNVCLPPLRERADFDILLANILREVSPTADILIADDVLRAMKRYRWPGNLRQLSHVLRAAVALLDEAETLISWQHLGGDLVQELGGNVDASMRAEFVVPRKPGVSGVPDSDNLHLHSMHLIQQALHNANGNVSAAARNLGISRQTLYRKLQMNES